MKPSIDTAYQSHVRDASLLERHNHGMRAATRSRYGPPSVLSVDDISTPEPGDGEIQVRVHATTVNRTDCGVLLGKPFLIKFFTGLRRPRALVPGSDVAGEVSAIGDGVTEFAVGDRVWGFHDTGLASQAEYLTIAQDATITKIPDGITYTQAAASAEGAHYAINFMKRVRYEPGQRVFVYGATGAIGSAAVQLLKARGSEVVAACHADHLELVEKLGADSVIDYTTTDLATYAERFDLVFDAVGKSTFATCKPLLTEHGRYVSSELGPHAQNVYLPITTRLRPGPRVDFPIPTGSKESILQMSELLAASKFNPLVDRHFPLDDVRRAYEYVMTGKKLGNVILDIANGGDPGAVMSNEGA